MHDSERDAFAAQLTALGQGTTLLVDTFDVARAVRTAVELAGPGLGAVRIDSGDLPMVARQVRELLDELGAKDTRIVLSGDLNEYSIAALAAAPVDGYGVGYLAGHRVRGAHRGAGLQARGPGQGDDGEGRWSPWPSGRSASRAGGAGSGRPAQLDDGGVAVTELITRADTAAELGGPRSAPCCARWSGAARSSAGSRWRGARAAPRGPGRAAGARAPAVPRLPGYPDGVRAGRRVGGGRSCAGVPSGLNARR